ncbi:hypothetical protein [Methylobacterium aquaticum]|uniref:Uncharacterized protein n=1 Tax=Methylobacterium aquaticum TaxID=270351 RepID=A0A0J6RWG9_9HYPH|nr:hypothetical protein [Methylobacterium aquaticum]KMO27190.1 hypothetical protein VP06_31435 [Methylobacterium aquaticum]
MKPASIDPLSVLVVVPTTGGPVVLLSLKRRPGLPASAAFAAGDYRPLPWSGDYARLAASGGPLSRLADAGPYELRLSGSFDAGRSWEVPVCLAHGLVARGHSLTADPEAADLVLWATGAVDLDLAVLPGDYALLDKLARSADLLAAAKADLVLLLPDGPEAAEAARAFRALGRAHPPVILPAASVPAALAALARPEPSPAPAAGRRSALAAALVALLAATVLAAGFAMLRARPEADRPVVAVGALVPVEPGPAVAPAPEPMASPEPVAVAAVVEELAAPAGSSCRRVAFGADPPVRRPVPAEAPGRLRASRLAPDLCGLAFRAAVPGARVAVGPELAAAALPPTRLPDGAQAYFLREGARRNLVYTVQVMTGSADAYPGAANPSATADRLVHGLVP